jgi:hypothetical protein
LHPPAIIFIQPMTLRVGKLLMGRVFHEQHSAYPMHINASKIVNYYKNMAFANPGYFHFEINPVFSASKQCFVKNALHAQICGFMQFHVVFGMKRTFVFSNSSSSMDICLEEIEKIAF